MGANLMYLKGGTKDHFMGFLAESFPHMVEGYGRLYAGAYATKTYVGAVRGMIAALQQRYDVGRRPSRGRPADDEGPEGRAATEQATLWDTEDTE